MRKPIKTRATWVCAHVGCSSKLVIHKANGVIPYRNIWEYMGIYGNIWEYMGIYRNIWEYMGIYGDIVDRYGYFLLIDG